MKMNKFLVSTLICMLSLAQGHSTSAAPNGQSSGHYASINGLKLYYTITGKGSPIILLHGAFSTIEKDFGKIIPALKKNHQLIGIELQGHGHTGNIDRALSYQNMAEDVIALMQFLNIPHADFIGYSMGGGVALTIATHRPSLINHLILLSVAYSPSGMNMQNPDGLKAKTSQDLNQSIWRKNYIKVAPDTSGWNKLVKNVYGLMGSWKGFGREEIKNIKSPTLLIFGDADMSKGEHQIEMFRLLGGGSSGDLYQIPNRQLAILPGTTHITMVEKDELLKPIIKNFINTPMEIPN